MDEPIQESKPVMPTPKTNTIVFEDGFLEQVKAPYVDESIIEPTKE